MGVPIDHYNDLIANLRAAFDDAAPDLPICKRRIESVFAILSNTHDGGDEDGIYSIAILAHDLGLKIKIEVVKQ